MIMTPTLALIFSVLFTVVFSLVMAVITELVNHGRKNDR